MALSEKHLAAMQAGRAKAQAEKDAKRRAGAKARVSAFRNWLRGDIAFQRGEITERPQPPLAMPSDADFRTVRGEDEDA